MNCRLEDFLNDFDLKEGDSFKANIFYQSMDASSEFTKPSPEEPKDVCVFIRNGLLGVDFNLRELGTEDWKSKDVSVESYPWFGEKNSIIYYTGDKSNPVLTVANYDIGTKEMVHLYIFTGIKKVLRK